MHPSALRILRVSATVAAVAVGVFAHAADVWTVTATGLFGSCTANATTDPNCTLDAAIFDAASEGDTILFAPAVQGHTIPHIFVVTTI